MAERELIISGLEAEGLKMWSSGVCTEWLHKASDASIAGVSATVNGPLFSDLCQATLYDDEESVQMFRNGADLYGRMCVTSIAPERSGKGIAMTGSIDQLWDDRAHSNMELLSCLKLDEFHAELHDITLADAKLGRITVPREVVEGDLQAFRFSPRFGVERGLKPDGSCKVRAEITCLSVYRLRVRRHSPQSAKGRHTVSMAAP